MAWCLAAGRRRRRPSSTRSPTPTTPTSRCQPDGDITAAEWEGLRTLYARRAPLFLRTALPGPRPGARALRPPPRRPRRLGHLRVRLRPVQRARARRARRARLAPRRPPRAAARWRCSPRSALPHSLGLLYEELTAHLGFRRSSDEYKVMAMASYGSPGLPRRASASSCAPTATAASASRDVDLGAFAPPLRAGRRVHRRATPTSPRTVQRRLEEVLLDLARWLHERTGDRDLVMAGGVALNCVANSRLWREGPFERVWVQPAAGDAGTALGAALHVAHALGDDGRADAAPRRSGAAGTTTSSPRGCATAGVAVRAAATTSPTRSPRRSPPTRSSPGSRAARSSGRARSGTARCSPTRGGPRTSSGSTTSRAASSSGRSRRWCSPSARAEIFDGGPIPSPYMLFTHRVRAGLARAHPGRRARRRHGADPDRRPRARSRSWRACSSASRRAPACPSSSTRASTPPGRPMVDDPRDALECFGSAPVDAARHRARSWCAAPGWRGRRRARRGAGRGVTVRRRHPDARGARPCAGCWPRSRRAPGRCPSRSSWSTTGRRGGRSALPRAGPRRPRDACLRGPARAARPRRATPGWRAGRAAWVAFLDDDVEPEPRLARRARRRPRRRRRRRGRRAGADRRAAARRPPPDGLGAQHRRARARALGDGRPGLPARRAGGGRRLRRALPARLPRGRRPRAAGHRARAGGSCTGARAVAPPGAPRAGVACRWPSRPATPTTC